VEVVASLSQGRTVAAQCGLFTYKSVLVIFEPPCIFRSLAYVEERWKFFRPLLYKEEFISVLLHTHGLKIWLGNCFYNNN